MPHIPYCTNNKLTPEVFPPLVTDSVPHALLMRIGKFRDSLALARTAQRMIQNVLKLYQNVQKSLYDIHIRSYFFCLQDSLGLRAFHVVQGMCVRVQVKKRKEISVANFVLQNVHRVQQSVSRRKYSIFQSRDFPSLHEVIATTVNHKDDKCTYQTAEQVAGKR